MAESASDSPESPLIRKADAVVRVTEWLVHTLRTTVAVAIPFSI
jgi:hypothetical protein